MPIMVPIEVLKAREKHAMQQYYEQLYQHLPALPKPMPHPAYWPEGQEKPNHSTDQESIEFYAACAQGNVDVCRAFVEGKSVSSADLAFGLEEATHNFQVEASRYLLRHASAPLHFRCFRRNQHHPQDLVNERPSDCFFTKEGTEQNILATERPELHSLLLVFLEDGGWHPNQLLGPIQKGKLPAMFEPVQEVALHYPRCLKDVGILRMLLAAGADPTIARERGLPDIFSLEEMPTIRLKGHILETAVNIATPDSVDLLLAHGASLDSANLLHSLARCSDKSRQKKHPLLTPEAFYPLDPAPRIVMAQHLLNFGMDINAWKNIYSIISRHAVWSLAEWQATPLYHAVLYQDWEYVQWLLEHGADPRGFPEPRDRYREMFVYPVRPEEADAKFQEILDRFLQSEE